MKKSLIILLLWGCHIPIEPENYSYNLTLNSRLSIDNNGYSHLVLSKSYWQTIHRISGTITANNEPIEFVKAYWESNLFWNLGDTLGYLVNAGYTDDLVYVLYDTTYITQFSDWTVPTINSASYSDSKGNIHTIFAPVFSMLGDTATIYVITNFTEINNLQIILD